MLRGLRGMFESLGLRKAPSGDQKPEVNRSNSAEAVLVVAGDIRDQTASALEDRPFAQPVRQKSCIEEFSEIYQNMGGMNDAAIQVFTDTVKKRKADLNEESITWLFDTLPYGSGLISSCSDILHVITTHPSTPKKVLLQIIMILDLARYDNPQVPLRSLLVPKFVFIAECLQNPNADKDCFELVAKQYSYIVIQDSRGPYLLNNKGNGLDFVPYLLATSPLLDPETIENVVQKTIDFGFGAWADLLRCASKVQQNEGLVSSDPLYFYRADGSELKYFSYDIPAAIFNVTVRELYKYRGRNIETDIVRTHRDASFPPSDLSPVPEEIMIVLAEFAAASGSAPEIAYLIFTSMGSVHDNFATEVILSILKANPHSTTIMLQTFLDQSRQAYDFFPLLKNPSLPLPLLNQIAVMASKDHHGAVREVNAAILAHPRANDYTRSLVKGN